MVIEGIDFMAIEYIILQDSEKKDGENKDDKDGTLEANVTASASTLQCVWYVHCFCGWKEAACIL